eukprot:CAMPEP_0113934856 /NCGR_PEP_ID=MMETSP1339-20121228/2113_1 /TAXON_ID=94617 /ORGANISM="Fibrocapsa japonica" /LENGTH=163 /DNA_ID=CAMNT_0000936805 /DNA_START=302 /DNA_END=793 /DNA_ORIENTATION=+ /assembly_acc=CAM_ASM_000762
MSKNERTSVLIFAGAFGAIVVAVFAHSLYKDLKKKREWREYKHLVESVNEQTYQCITVQVLDSVVVFPVQVRRRDAPVSRFYRIGEEFVQVELSQSGDPTPLLQALCRDVIGSDFGVKVWVGAGKSGPTGLAVGIVREGYGPSLANHVGMAIEQSIQKHTKSM